MIKLYVGNVILFVIFGDWVFLYWGNYVDYYFVVFNKEMG